MSNKLKKIGKIIAIISAVLLLGSIILHKQCDKPLQEPTKNEHLIQPEKYTLPVFDVPFLTKKAPVKKRNLPIPKKDVRTTIVVENPIPGARDITIVIDKKGKVYRSKDTPEDVEIKVTTWKPALFGLQSSWGIGIAMDIPPDLSFILSWDTIGIWKLYFGVDLGAKLTEYGLKDAWLGISVKYKILRNNNLFALVGYNWMNKTPYVGVSLRF